MFASKSKFSVASTGILIDFITRTGKIGQIETSATGPERLTVTKRKEEGGRMKEGRKEEGRSNVALFKLLLFC